MGRLHLPARRRTGQRLYGVRQVYREPPHHRNGGRYAGDGSGAPAVRGSGNGEIVGVRAFGGGHQRRLHAHHPRYGGHQRRTDAVWLELCGTALQRAVPRRAGRKPAHARHVRGPHRPRGGTDPHPRRRAGYADHHPVRKDPPHPRAQRRSAGRARLQPHRHGEQPRQGRQRTVLRAQTALQHGHPARLPATEEDEISIVSKRVSEMGRALELPAEPPAMHEVRRVVQSSASCGTGRPKTARPSSSRPPAR